jgi:Tol biopolymer transport system component
VKKLGALLASVLFVLLASAGLPASAARLPVLAPHRWWPVFSPDGTHIAFTIVNGQGRVFALDVVDVGTHRVTRLAQSGSQLLPSWSPDGKRVAYQSAGRIWTVGITGTARRAVHTGYSPAWSPDGKTIAYVRPAAGGAGVLQAGAASLAQDVIGAPAWSPDGRELAFQRSSGIYAVTLAGAERQLAVTNLEPGRPVWSPDGTRVAYTAGANVYIVAADGASAPRRVAGPYADLGSLSWSPTGDELAYNVRGGVQLTVLTSRSGSRSSRLVAGSGAGTSFAGDILAYSGPNPRCPGHDAIRTVNDVVAGSCEITGTAAGDVIEGTRQGGDVIVAGAGNDTIRARNGHRDLISCGPGRDVVRADRADRLNGCENVVRR